MKTPMALAMLAAGLSLGVGAAEPTLTFSKQWTHGHTTTGQFSEIPAFDPRTNTIWVAGVVGVDVLDAATGALVTHIDVTPSGNVNSVAVHEGLAAFAIESKVDRRNAGVVLFYDTATMAPAAGVASVAVGSLPDMLTFTHDGSRLLVANEATPNPSADMPYTPGNDPAGSVSIIDVASRSVLATAGFAGVPILGDNVRTNTGMDLEPEYIAVDADDAVAYVTLQEANAVGVLDLELNAFTAVIGLGTKDFSAVGNEIDPKDNDGAVLFRSVAVRGLYMPDGVASYEADDRTYLVMANEGDFREDNADRAAASTLGSTNPLDRLRIVKPESTAGNLFAAGARSFSIRDTDGTLVYDSGSILDREAATRGLYDDGRSRDKGVEPEGVVVLKINGRTYAFIGLERTTQSAVAIFDVTVPADSQFVDLIVTPGDLAPEGLVAYKHKGRHFLAISNETVAPGATTSNTTLYSLESNRSNGGK